ncbi:uncharacterized protein PHACADRAFT_201108 [Phanerochaete carnosa HHB-10118-sp]|uniref:Uncharacterized protein n=1 Tax=Phanerochaete carnosa (strain HHB-10118-sp) TaxID=650164 RepID=K5VTZ7_PHACS|nr:uncharacterized protein PHACADRAFT_201108 [Phanerochaete carnosa HHB-10118-sp]EKM50265.1 hypothetical protein PHACADRAFT_201108 [Phanerochaete carnosa HHB-10118-sp]
MSAQSSQAVAQAYLEACATLEIMNWIFFLAEFLQSSLFSALRVFIIWDRSYIWSLVVFALSMIPFATNLHNAVESKYSFGIEPYVGATCIEEPLFSARTDRIAKPSQYRIGYSTRSSLILADAIVLVLTWIKTFDSWKNARRADVRASLTTCLLRDGTIYFVLLVAINVAQMATDNASGEVSLVGVLMTTLPSVLINRFMINLRTAGSEVSNYSTHMSEQQQQGQSTAQFRRPTDWLGNVGETLEDAWSEEPCDEENGAVGVDEGEHRDASAEA